MRTETIQTEHWIPNPDKAGYLKLDRQAKLRDVTRQIKQALDRVLVDGEYTALQTLEWINGPHNGWADDQPADAEWPAKTHPLVTVQHGANEGWHILILAEDSHGAAMRLYTIKYLLGRADVWRIAAALDAAFVIN